MREEELRRVLLVKAVEESDPKGFLIPIGDRIAASREAKRNKATSAASWDTQLAARADALLGRFVERHAIVAAFLVLVGGPAWVRWILIALSLTLGITLSTLDGTRRINILAFPLIGLVLWNLAMYAAILIAVLRKPAAAISKRTWLSGVVTYVGLAQASRIVVRSRAFDLSLSQALGEFTREWYEAAKPLLVLRAKRVLHLCAAAVGIGLIVGLYLRGIAFDYRAGWESTFLDPAQVRVLLSVLYEPGLTLTGMVVPDASYLSAIRWRNGDGESAARWIHLLAVTAAVFVVAPRLLIVLLTTIAITRLSRIAPLPPDLVSYYRRIFGADGSGKRSVVRVVPYAYEPNSSALARLRTLLTGEHGEELAVDVQPLLRYGDEDAYLASLQEGDGALPDSLVLLTSLAATPEDENHGALIAEVRDWLIVASPSTHLLVVVDEGPYVGRMSAAGGAQNRVDERRCAWREFVSARGVKACLADLSR